MNQIQRGDPILLRGAWDAFHRFYVKLRLTPLDQFLSEKKKVFRSGPLSDSLDLPQTPSDYAGFGLTTWMVSRAVIAFQQRSNVILQIKGNHDQQVALFQKAYRLMDNPGGMSANKRSLLSQGCRFTVTSVDDSRPIGYEDAVFDEDEWMRRLIRRVSMDPYRMMRYVELDPARSGWGLAFAEEEEFLMDLDPQNLELLQQTRPDIPVFASDTWRG